MIEAGIWKSKSPARPEVRGWRPRRSGFGESVQWDTCDHGLLFKGSDMYDGVVRVPCIMRAPGKFAAKTVVNSLLEELDILPTILDVLGVPKPASIQGSSLLGATKYKQAVFAEFPTIEMARTKEWKLVHYIKAKYGELYRLTEDPHELTNLWDDPKHATARADMEAILFDWLASTQDPLLAPVRDPAESAK